MKFIFLLFLSFWLQYVALCQVPDNKTQIIDEELILENRDSIFFKLDTLVIGSKAQLKIDGVILVFSPFIIIAPGARIEGEGKLLLLQPEKTDKQTFLDANGNMDIDLRIEIANRNNLILSELFHSYLGDNNLKSNDFINDQNISLEDDGVCIELRGNRLSLGKNAILEHSSAKRCVITAGDSNSIFSKNILGKSTYSFAIGIDEGDYSPVVITPAKDGEFFVELLRPSLKEEFLQFSNKNDHIDRVWGVYANHNVNTTYTFEHSEIDDEKLKANNKNVEVYQYSEDEQWKLMTTSYVERREHSIKGWSDLIKLPSSYFTKFGKVIHGPQLADDNINVKRDESVSIPVLANDRMGDFKLVKKSLNIFEAPKNGFVEILPNGNINYRPFLGFSGSDLLTYEVEDESGVKATATVFITIESDGGLILSNVVTPNGDGFNDRLTFIASEEFINLELIIVNRSGDRLFESKNYKNTWDGNSLSGGTYYYILKANQKNGDYLSQKGWILLNK